jgi:hypothetical protein
MEWKGYSQGRSLVYLYREYDCEYSGGSFAKSKIVSQVLRAQKQVFEDRTGSCAHVPLPACDDILKSSGWVVVLKVLQANARSEESDCALLSSDDAWSVVDISLWGSSP